MRLGLYMIGVVARDLKESIEFYRRLGLDIPDGRGNATHIPVRMRGDVTFS